MLHWGKYCTEDKCCTGANNALKLMLKFSFKIKMLGMMTNILIPLTSFWRGSMCGFRQRIVRAGVEGTGWAGSSPQTAPEGPYTSPVLHQLWVRGMILYTQKNKHLTNRRNSTVVIKC